MEHLGKQITFRVDFPVDFELLGDAAVIWRSPLALALHASLASDAPRGVSCSVPAEDVLTVFYDPAVLDPDALQAELARRIPALRPPAPERSRTVVLPVIYDGPDLEDVARLTGLSRADVVDLHVSTLFEVAFLGFLPGFAYLRGLPEILKLPRRSTPRTRVEPGSVAVGGPWAGVYPLPSPGGWHLLGRTTTAMFDAARAEPILLRPGDAVRFEPC